MDLGFTEEQEMLRKSARDFLEAECPPRLVREMEQDPRGYPPGLWQKMAGLGWLGLPFPAAYGGLGLGYLDLALLLEEMGRALLPAPYLETMVVGLAILDHGTEAQKRELLPKIAAGELILTYAIDEPGSENELSTVSLAGRPDGDFYVLEGTKLFVPWANVAGYILTAARTPEGLTALLVPGNAPGLTVELLKTIAKDKQAEVTYDGVRVGRDAVVGEPGGGEAVFRRLIQRATAAACAYLVGGAQKAFEMAVNYAKTRVQFGVPIGSFQAIQHKCANMVTDVDGARFVTYQAAWALSEGLDAEREVAIAKGWASEACRRVFAEAHQIHGAIGFTRDYDLQLYTRRGKALEIRFGDLDFQRELVARTLGLD